MEQVSAKRSTPGSFGLERRTLSTFNLSKEMTAMPTLNYRIVLNSRPESIPTTENFRMDEQPIPTVSAGQMLLRTDYLSLNSYMRKLISSYYRKYL